jgi:hypothetical protein
MPSNLNSIVFSCAVVNTNALLICFCPHVLWFFAFSCMFLSVLSICLQVSALNESVTGSVKSVFKSWEHRLDNSSVSWNNALS